MSDKIVIRGLKFYCYHGVLESERSQGQCFLVDLDLYRDFSGAVLKDVLEDTVDYRSVICLVKEIMEGPPYMLLETLADNLAGKILRAFDFQKVRVKIKKPFAPVSEEFDYIGVDITRRRKDVK